MNFLKNNPILTLSTLIFLNLTSCTNYHEIEVLPGIDNELVMEVVLPYAINLEHDKRLRLEDSTIYYGGNGNYIKKMCLIFSSQSIVELREARGLLVDVVDGLLDSLTNDPTLGPLISGYPLSSDDLEICIKFESYLGLYVDGMYIHWIMLQDKFSYFYAFDMTNEFNIWDINSENWHERVEPFYKSRQIVTIERAAEKAYKEKTQKKESVLSNELYQGSTLETNRAEVSTQL